MASDNFDPEEIDRLVKELTGPLKHATPPPPPLEARVVEAASAPALDPAALPPGRRWTTARLLMPAARTERRNRFAFATAISLPIFSRLTMPVLSDAQWNVLSARIFVALGVLFAAAMPYWPYAHAWSWGLLVYFFAIMLLVITGIWGAKLTWDARLPAAHTVAIGRVLWGFGLLAAEAVPRIVLA